MGETENLAMESGGTPAEDIAPRPLHSLAPHEIWNLWDLLLFLVFFLVALLVLTPTALFGYAVLRPLLGWHTSRDSLLNNLIFQLTMQSILYVSTVGFLLLLARFGHQQPFWKSLGWKKPTARQVAGYLAGGGGLALAVSLALAVRPDTQGFPLEKLFDSRTASYAIGAFAIGVAPVVEELVFRGLVFSLARGSTGSLTPSIILHVGYNFLIMTGLFLSTQHFRVVSGFWRQ